MLKLMANLLGEEASMDGDDLATLFDEKPFWGDVAEKKDTKISEYMQTDDWNVDCLKMLLEEGHDPNSAAVQKNGKASLPLLIATRCHNLSAVKLLLECGAKVQKRDNKIIKWKGSYVGTNALEEACSRGYLDIVEEMFRYDVDEDDCVSALVSAVETDRVDIVRCLCEQEINLRACDPFDKSALYVATERQNTQIISLLLKHGALSENTGEYWPLVEACKIGNMKIIKQLIEGGCRVNESGKYEHGFTRWRTTPLCSALRNKHTDIVKYLIEEKGANVNRLNSHDSESPMCIAAQMGDIEMVKYLFRHGADVCDIGNIGDFSLECACTGNSPEVVNFMIEKGAVLDVRSSGLCLMIIDLKRTENNYDNILKLLLCENVLVFYAVPLAEQDGWEEFLSRFIDNCIANPELFSWIIIAGCDRKVLFKLRHFEFIKGLFAEHPYGYEWSAETEASYREYFKESAQKLEDCVELRTYIDSVITSPERLTVLCRQNIRNCLGTHISNKVDYLPIATYHKNYLLIPEM